MTDNVPFQGRNKWIAKKLKANCWNEFYNLGKLQPQIVSRQKININNDRIWALDTLSCVNTAKKKQVESGEFGAIGMKCFVD